MREEHGWPVWKHVNKGLCNVKDVDGDWLVQKDQNVGVNALAIGRPEAGDAAGMQR